MRKETLRRCKVDPGSPTQRLISSSPAEWTCKEPYSNETPTKTKIHINHLHKRHCVVCLARSWCHVACFRWPRQPVDVFYRVEKPQTFRCGYRLIDQWLSHYCQNCSGNALILPFKRNNGIAVCSATAFFV